MFRKRNILRAVAELVVLLQRWPEARSSGRSRIAKQFGFLALGRRSISANGPSRQFAAMQNLVAIGA